MKREELRTLAEHGMTKGRADNNPVELTADGIERMLEGIYARETERERASA